MQNSDNRLEIPVELFRPIQPPKGNIAIYDIICNKFKKILFIELILIMLFNFLSFIPICNYLYIGV